MQCHFHRMQKKSSQDLHRKEITIQTLEALATVGPLGVSVVAAPCRMCNRTQERKVNVGSGDWGPPQQNDPTIE